MIFEIGTSWPSSMTRNATRCAFIEGSSVHIKNSLARLLLKSRLQSHRVTSEIMWCVQLHLFLLTTRIRDYFTRYNVKRLATFVAFTYLSLP